MDIDKLKKIVKAISSYCGFEDELPNKTTYLKDENGRIHYRFYYDDLFLPDESMNIFDNGSDIGDASISTEPDDVDGSNIYKVKNLIDDVDDIIVDTEKSYIDILPKDQTITIAKGESTIARVKDGKVLLVESSKRGYLSEFARATHKNVLLVEEDSNAKEAKKNKGDDEDEEEVHITESMGIVFVDIRYPHKQCHEALREYFKALSEDKEFMECAKQSFAIALADYSNEAGHAHEICRSNLRICNDDAGYGSTSLFALAKFWEGLGLPENFTSDNLLVANENSIKEKIANGLSDKPKKLFFKYTPRAKTMVDKKLKELLHPDVYSKAKESEKGSDNPGPTEGITAAETNCYDEAGNIRSVIKTKIDKYKEWLQKPKVKSNSAINAIANSWAGKKVSKLAANAKNAATNIAAAVDQDGDKKLPRKFKKINSIVRLILSEVYKSYESPDQYKKENDKIDNSKKSSPFDSSINQSHSEMSAAENQGKAAEKAGKGVNTAYNVNIEGPGSEEVDNDGLAGSAGFVSYIATHESEYNKIVELLEAKGFYNLEGAEEVEIEAPEDENQESSENEEPAKEPSSEDQASADNANAQQGDAEKTESRIAKKPNKALNEEAMLDSIYDEGYRAFYDGVKLEANPYGQDNEYRQDWEQGWKDADDAEHEKAYEEEYAAQQAFDQYANENYDFERGDWKY